MACSTDPPYCEGMNRFQIYFTREQSRRVDKLAIAAGTPGIELMENAASGCVAVLMEHRPENVLVYAGIGNNGGDGFAIARLLRQRAIGCRVVLCGNRNKVAGDALINLQRLENLNIHVDSLDHAIDVEQAANGQKFDWIVDALLGTGASGDPRPPYDQIIRIMNHADQAKRLAIDIPSGLDCDTGVPGDPTVRADITCTFVTKKIGFQNPQATNYLGDVKVVDIGITDDIVERILAETHDGEPSDGC